MRTLVSTRSFSTAYCLRRALFLPCECDELKHARYCYCCDLHAVFNCYFIWDVVNGVRNKLLRRRLKFRLYCVTSQIIFTSSAGSTTIPECAGVGPRTNSAKYRLKMRIFPHSGTKLIKYRAKSNYFKF